MAALGEFGSEVKTAICAGTYTGPSVSLNMQKRRGSYTICNLKYCPHNLLLYTHYKEEICIAAEPYFSPEY